MVWSFGLGINEKVYKLFSILYVMEKRGLSNLVATVLIILLALAAVALVWGFLQPSFERTGVSIDLGTECLAVDIKPISCSYAANSSQNGTYATVNVQYTNGNVAGIIASVEWTGGTVNATRTSAPDALVTKAVQVNGTSNLAIAYYPMVARATAVVSDGVNEKICPESATEVACENTL